LIGRPIHPVLIFSEFPTIRFNHLALLTRRRFLDSSLCEQVEPTW
jgi:hypothetical protein